MKGLDVLRRELDAVQATDEEYVIFGSTALNLRGIIDREPGDIDAYVSKRVWGALLARKGWKVLTPAAGDPPILSLKSQPTINLFFDWTKKDKWMDVSATFASAENVNGFMLCSVEEVVKHKTEASAKQLEPVQKHINDLEQVRSLECLTL